MTMPAKISTIKTETSSGSINRNPLSLFFFSEYLFTFNYLYILNSILQNPLRFGLKSFSISGVFYLHHKYEASSGRGNLVRWRRRLAQKVEKESVVPEVVAGSDDGFQKVGKDEDRVFRVFRNVLDTLTGMERLAYPRGLTRTVLDAPRKNANDQIRFFEARSNNQAVLRDGSRFTGLKGKGGRGKK
eukprot:gnl/Chilomastix_caulleri/1615.p1 GENE.gnl/Chilomastix_caulleri/1615~~gnl/Chilomastix_caulleri/1615.p1  ORF type:complete len:187 (-),score=58.44 gnl/Chilomastix_caulleri/1615:54-614(-)